MSFFEYNAVDSLGKKKSGLIESDSVRTATRQLKSQQLTIFSISQTNRSLKVKQKYSFKKQLSISNIAFFTRQIASLIEASMPVDEALQTIIRNSNQKKLSKVVAEIRSFIIEGQSLAESFALSNTLFPPYYIATIKAGEQSGDLALVLNKLSIDLEQQNKFKKKITSALIYPIVISIVAIIVVIALLVMVVPQIVSVFDDMQQTLPPLTIAIITLSDFLTNNFQLLLISVIFIIFVSYLALKKKVVKLLVHKIIQRIPVFGYIIVVSNAIRFCRTFSLLHASNTPVVSAMQSAAEVLNFLPMKLAIINASKKVREGSSIFKSFEKNKALPPMFLYMLASGESSGNLSPMLDKVVVNQEFELETYISKVISLFEPLMILLMGGIVLLIVLAILLPIFELNQISL